MNRSRKVEDAVEPLGLIIEAIHAAIKDSNTSEKLSSELKSSIDSISVVNTWTWSYKDLPTLVEQKLGTKAGYKALSGHSGNSPGLMLDESARRIARGESKVAVVVGAEALASCEKKRLSPALTEIGADLSGPDSSGSIRSRPQGSQLGGARPKCSEYGLFTESQVETK